MLLNICILFVTNVGLRINVGERAQGNRVEGREKACNFPWRRRNDTFPSFPSDLSPPLTRVKPSSYTRKLLGDALADSYLCGWNRKDSPRLLSLLFLRLCYNRVVDSTAEDSSSICGRPIRRVQRDCGKENLIVLSGSLVDKLSLCDRRNGRDGWMPLVIPALSLILDRDFSAFRY